MATERERLLEVLLLKWLAHRINEYGDVNPGYDPSFVGRTVDAVGMPKGYVYTEED